MDRRRLEGQLYYGLAVLAALFVVVGLTAALKGAGAEQEEGKDEEPRNKKEEAQSGTHGSHSQLQERQL